MPHSTNRSGYASSKERIATVRGEVRVEDDEALVLCAQLEKRLPVRLDDVLVRDTRLHAGTRLRLALEAVASGDLRLDLIESDGIESECGQLRVDSRHELGERAVERLVVGRSRVPAVRATSLAKGDRVLHERHRLALDRVCDERLRLVRAVPELGKRRAKRRVVVTVCSCAPSSRRPAACPRGRRAGRSPPSACRTGARSGRRSPRDARGGPPRAACSASQFWPSCSSPSPTITTTRPPRPSRRFAQAMPRPFEMPMPSEPEFASMPATPTSGWPSSPPWRRSRRKRSRGITPRAKSAA